MQVTSSIFDRNDVTTILTLLGATVVLLLAGYGSISLVFVLLAAFFKAWEYPVRARKYIYTEDGCFVEYRHQQVFYAWDEIITKRIEIAHMPYKWPYVEGAVFFSIRKTLKASWTEPFSYCMNHPRTCFFVYFRPSRYSDHCLGIFEVDKEVFIGKLAEWGVKLD